MSLSFRFRFVLSLGALTALPSAGLQAEDRSIDGMGNNLLQPSMGAAGTMLPRWGTAGYADGMNTPSGGGRANPRTISNTVSAQSGPLFSQRGLSDFVWQWGQFLDHDIDLTESNDAEPMPIVVSDPSDPLFPVIPMSRSVFEPTTGDSPANPRQQLNGITAFIDASMVYGSDTVRATALRSANGGRLATSGNNMLPKNTTGLPNANAVGADPTSLYLAGDVRANEHTGLTAMHTLFVREHNRLADAIAAANPGWDDEQIYQRARKLVGAQIQVITYNEFLPALLGPQAPSMAGPGYDDAMNAAVVSEFSTALYRLGHSMVSDRVRRVQNDGSDSPRGDLSLADVFFNPTTMATSQDVDEVLKGLASQRMQEVDTKVVSVLRNNLFGPPGAGGLDLAALNINRGRDHGLPDYNTLRELVGLTRVTQFGEITSDGDVVAALESVYPDINDVDTWVGMLAEDHLPGASVGETIAAGMHKQFVHLRDGDRFYFEYDPSFTPVELDALRGTTLAEIILRNTGITNLQANVFFAIPEPSSVAMMLLLVVGVSRRGRAGCAGI